MLLFDDRTDPLPEGWRRAPHRIHRAAEQCERAVLLPRVCGVQIRPAGTHRIERDVARGMIGDKAAGSLFRVFPGPDDVVNTHVPTSSYIGHRYTMVFGLHQ